MLHTGLRHARALTAALLLAGCVHMQAQAPAASVASPADLAFVTDMYNVVEFDQHVITAASAHEQDPRVAALAADLLAQANEFDAKVRPIAARDGIRPPDAISFRRISDRRAQISAIVAHGRHYYDSQFLADEIASHEQALASVGTFQNQQSGDPLLKRMAVEGIIRVRFNLQRLQALQREIQAEA